MLRSLMILTLFVALSTRGLSQEAATSSGESEPMSQRTIIKRLEALASVNMERGEVRSVTVDSHYGEVFRLVAQCPTVTKVSIYTFVGSSISDDDLRHLKAHPGVRELAFFHGKGLTDEASEVFPTLPSLQKLVLGGKESFGDRSLEHVSRCTNLRSLSIYHLKATESGLSHLHRLKELTDLNLQEFPEPSRFAASLQFPKLEKLSIHGAGVDDAVAAAISRMTTLRDLCVVDSGVTDEGFKGIASLPHLESLLLSGNQRVTSESAKLLAGMSNLNQLTWAKMPVDDSLVRVLTEIKRLKFLDVKHTDLSKAQAAALAEALPDCALFTDHDVYP